VYDLLRNMVFYFCHVIGCNKRLFSAKALIGHMCLMHSDNSMLNLTCGIDACNYLYNTAETFRKHVRLHHSSHWESVSTAPQNVECEMDIPVLDGSVDDVPLANDTTRAGFDNFLNNFAKHLAFLKLKITESYMLPKSVAHCFSGHSKPLRYLPATAGSGAGTTITVYGVVLW